MDDHLFEETYENVKNGIENHEFIDLITWVKEQFDIDVCNIAYDEILQGTTPRLNFILRTHADLIRFSEEVGTLDKSKASKFFEFHFKKSERYKTQNAFVITDSFESWCLGRLSNYAGVLKDRIVNEHEEIWFIQQIGLHFIVFTFKAEQIDSLQPLSSQFQVRFFESLKRHDEFNFLTMDHIAIGFDSKENFDNKFEGSWRRYFD
jgi:hypothetical protein